MKHINITNWQGNITDWTKFNYVYGGLEDSLADRVNLSIPGTNLRNYIRKSNNILNVANMSATQNGITYTISDGVVTLNGTASSTVFIIINQTIKAGTYTWALFNPTTQYDSSLSPLDNNLRVELRAGVGGVVIASQAFFDTVNKTKTFDLERDTSSIYIRVSKDTVLSNFKFSLMLVSGSTVPTTYEPYGTMVMVENVDKITFNGSESWTKRSESGSYISFYRNFTSDYKKVASSQYPNAWSALSIFDFVPQSEWGNTGNILTLDSADRTTNNIGIAIQKSLLSSSDIAGLQSYLSNNNLIVYYELDTPKTTIIYTLTLNGGSDEDWADRSSTTTLSMTSLTQLDSTNVEEDVEYLEDTEFNEEILSDEE